MSQYNRKFEISLPWLILGCTLTLLVPLVYMSVKMTTKSFTADEGPLWLFAVGLVPGLVVALAQFILSWAEFKQISKFSAMKIKGVLNSRDGEKYYGDIIANAQTRIDILGVTASRFVSHFADETSDRPEKKILITALKNGVQVRFLLPERCHLSQPDQAEKFSMTARAFVELRQNFNNLEVKYFDHTATTSIVRVDDEVLVGPVFHNILSRNTPTIHTTMGSKLAQSYIEYFEREWNEARAI